MPLSDSTTASELLLGCRFRVSFITHGDKPVDFQFQKVRGISAEVQTTQQPEGGQNLYTQRLPTGISYGNLVLERGILTAPKLDEEINETLATFKFKTSNVLVMLQNEQGKPVASWFFFKAYPVKWSTSDLDASQGNQIVIDTVELAYTSMQVKR